MIGERFVAAAHCAHLQGRLLFRHRLADRMSKHQEVIYGCFAFLSFAAMDDRLCFPLGPPFSASVRRERLLELNALFMHEWWDLKDGPR